MQVKWPLILGFAVLPLGCKTHRETTPGPLPANEVTEIESSPQESPTHPTPGTMVPPTSGKTSDAPVDLCATRPDLYQRKDGKCEIIPLPSVEGELNISSGVIWKPDLSRCRRTWSNGGFKFCSGGVHASIPVALPTQGSGKARFSISFNCKSFPAQNSLELSIGNETKLTLTSVTVDTPIFSDEIPVEAGVVKSVRLDFKPNYDATYPGDCLINLIENRVI
jgi:hypothetical protein